MRAQRRRNRGLVRFSKGFTLFFFQFKTFFMIIFLGLGSQKFWMKFLDWKFWDWDWDWIWKFLGLGFIFSKPGFVIGIGILLPTPGCSLWGHVIFEEAYKRKTSVEKHVCHCKILQKGCCEGFLDVNLNFILNSIRYRCIVHDVLFTTYFELFNLN